MTPLYLDTHVLVWLYAGDADRFPPAATQALETSRLLASPMAGLELQYLHEIGRLKPTAATVLEYLEERLALTIDDTPCSIVSRRAWQLRWTRNPFDRMIVALAAVNAAPLLTKDEGIRAHYRLAQWDS